MFLELLDVSLWVLLAGVIAGELYLLVVRHRALWLRLGYFALVLAVCIVAWYQLEEPTAARTLEPQRYFWFVALIFSVPIGLSAIVLELASRIRLPAAPHGLYVVWAILLALAWPTAALLTHCAIGLECF